MQSQLDFARGLSGRLCSIGPGSRRGGHRFFGCRRLPWRMAAGDRVAPCSSPGDSSPPELPNQTTLEIDTTREGEKRKKCRPPSLAVPPVSPKALRFAEDDEWMLPEVSSVSVDPAQREHRKTLSTPTPHLRRDYELLLFLREA
eukprot:s5267_g5.t1